MSYFQAALYRASVAGDREGEPGVADPFWWRRLSGVRVSTTTAGFGVLSGRYGCAPVEARQALGWLGRHVKAWSRGQVVFEGRVEQVQRAELGVEVTAVGYYNALDDLVFDQKFGGKVDAAGIAQAVLARYAPLLSADETFVRPVGFTLAMDDYDGAETPKAVLESSLEASEDPDPTPFYAMVRDERRLWLVPQERRLVSWTIPARALAGPVEFARDLQELYTSVVVVWEKPVKSGSGASTPQRVTTPTPDDPDILRELGFRRVLSVSAGKSVDSEAEARTFGEATLRQYAAGITAFSLRVAGPVRNHIGSRVEPQFIRAGCLVRIEQAPGDEQLLDDAYRLAFVSEVEWDVDDGQVTLQCEAFDDLTASGTPVLASSGLWKVA